MPTETQKSILIKIYFYVTVAVAVFVSLKLLSGPLFPFLIALVLAVSVQRFIRKWSKKLRLRKKAVSIALIMAIYIVVGLIIGFLVYALCRQLVDVLEVLQRYTNQISETVSHLLARFKSFFGILPKVTSDAAMNTMVKNTAQFITEQAGSLAAKIPTFFLSLTIMVITSAYLAKDYDEISNYFAKVMSTGTRKKLIYIKNVMLARLGAMLKGYAVIMFITFLELLVGLLILRYRYALIISAVTAVVDILPVLGTGTVLIPWAVITAVLGNPTKAAELILLYIIITLVHNIVEPRVMGEKLGIHPILMLLSVFLGLKLFGAAGVVLLPITVVAFKSWLDSRNTNVDILSDTMPKKVKKRINTLSIKKKKTNFSKKT